MFDDFFQYFLGSQGGPHGRVWHHMKFAIYYTPLFKKNRSILSDTAFLMEQLAYIEVQEVSLANVPI